MAFNSEWGKIYIQALRGFVEELSAETRIEAACFDGLSTDVLKSLLKKGP